MQVGELFALPELACTCYVVGGWVRDRLLQRIGRKVDLDLVLPEGAIDISRAIARKLKGGFVILDQDRQIARVVLPDLTIDFAQQIGSSLLEDLSLRDFTINGIAQEIHNLENYIDPHHGRIDLQNRVIRMIHPDNLKADRLRVLRAYRLAAQLDFRIEDKTQIELCTSADGLKAIASERIFAELCHLLLAGELGTTWLIRAITDRVLSAWLKEDFLELERFSRIDSAIALLINTYPQLQAFFNQPLTKERPAIITVKLAALANSAYAVEPLGFSKIEQKWLLGILRHLPQLREILSSDDPVIYYRFYQKVKDFFPALIAVAIAQGWEFTTLQPLLNRWLDPCDPLVYPVNLITGDELQTLFHLKPSPQIGELLEAVRIAQVKGEVRDRHSAIALIKQRLNQ
ncbi:MAG: CCA tRNA nucleotidyltransferase [Pseudanabaenaceae cyanobacterium]